MESSSTLACGSASFFLIFLGVSGFGASLIALILASMRARLALVAGVIAIAIGVLALVGGFTAGSSIRRELTSGPIPGMAELDPDAAARRCGAMGIGSGA